MAINISNSNPDLRPKKYAEVDNNIYEYEKTEVRPVNVGALPNTKEKKY